MPDSLSLESLDIDSVIASDSLSTSFSISTSESASMNVSNSVSSSTSALVSLDAFGTAYEDKVTIDKRNSQALPKTGEEDSSLSMAFAALLTATGLAFFAKGKRDDEEGEDY